MCDLLALDRSIARSTCSFCGVCIAKWTTSLSMSSTVAAFGTTILLPTHIGSCVQRTPHRLVTEWALDLEQTPAIQPKVRELLNVHDTQVPLLLACGRHSGLGKVGHSAHDYGRKPLSSLCYAHGISNATAIRAQVSQGDVYNVRLPRYAVWLFHEYIASGVVLFHVVRSITVSRTHNFRLPTSVSI